MIPSDIKTISVGTQTLYDLGPRMRYTISKILPVKGAMFQFSIRARVFDMTDGKPLEVKFSEYPSISVLITPEIRREFGEAKKEVKLIKNRPMLSYWFSLAPDLKLVKR